MVLVGFGQDVLALTLSVADEVVQKKTSTTATVTTFGNGINKTCVIGCVVALWFTVLVVSWWK